MANTLMFEVGIKEADNQLTELEKRLKNIVNTYGKLELKVQVDGLKTFTSALENIGQGKGLEALQRRLDLLQVTLSNAGMAGVKSMQEFEAAVKVNSTVADQYRKRIEELTAARNKFIENTEPWRKANERLNSFQNDKNTLAIFAQEQVAIKNLEDAKTRLSNTNNQEAESYNKVVSSINTLNAAANTLKATLGSWDPNKGSIGQLVEQFEKLKNEIAAVASGLKNIDPAKLNFSGLNIDLGKVAGIGDLNTAIRGLEVSINEIINLFTRLGNAVKLDASSEIIKKLQADADAAQKTIQELTERMNSLAAAQKNVAETASKTGKSEKQISDSQTAMFNRYNKLLADIQNIKREIVGIQQGAGGGGPFGDKLGEYFTALNKIRNVAREITSSPSIADAITRGMSSEQLAKLNSALASLKTNYKEVISDAKDFNKATDKGSSQAEARIRKLGMAFNELKNYMKANGGSEEMKRLQTEIQGAIRKMRDLMNAGRFGEAVNVYERLSGIIRQAATATKEFERAQHSVSSTVSHTNSQLQGQSQILSDLKSMAMQYLSVWGAQSFINNIIELGGQLEQQRLSIGAILQDTAQANHLFGQIKDLAIKSPFGVQQLDAMTKQLSAYGFQYSELYEWTKRLADISAATGTSVDRLALALGHVRSEGALSGYTLRQFSMGNIPLLQKLSENLGKTKQEIRKMTRNKEIGYEDVLNVLKQLTDESGMFYQAQETMAQALNAKFKNLRDSFQIMYSEMAEGAPGDFLKGVAEVLTDISKSWRVLMPVILSGGATLGVWKLSTMALNHALERTSLGLTQNAIATSKYSVAQLRAIATTGRWTLALRGLGNALMSIGKFIFNPWTLGFAAVEGLIYLWSKHNDEVRKAKDLTKAYGEAAVESEKNIAKQLDKIKPFSNQLDDSTLKTGIDSMTESIKNYAVNGQSIINGMFGKDAEGNVMSLAEKYQYLRGELEDTIKVYKELKRVKDAFEYGITNSDGGWFDDNVETDLTQYADAYKKFVDDVTAYNSQYGNSIENAIKNAQNSDSAFREATKNMKSYGEMLAEFWSNTDKYKNAVQPMQYLFGSGAGSDKALNLNESFFGYLNKKNEAMSELDQFIENTETRLKEKGYDFSKKLAPEQVGALLKMSKDWLEKHPEWENIYDAIKEKLEGRWPIKIEPDAEAVPEQLSGWQQEIQDWLDEHGLKIQISPTDSHEDFIKKVKSLHEAAQTAMDNSGKVLIGIGFKLDNLPSELPSPLATPWNQSNLDTYNEKKSTVDAIEQLKKKFNFSWKEKGGNKGSKNPDTERAKAVREQVRVIKEAADAFQYWRNKVGDKGAWERVQSEFGDILTKIGITAQNIDDVRSQLKKIPQMKEYQAIKDKKIKTEIDKEIAKDNDQFIRKDFERDTEKFLSQTKLQLDNLTRSWETFNSVREATGNIDLAVQLSGVTYLDGQHTFADALKEKIKKDLAEISPDLTIDFNVNLSDEEIQREVEEVFNAAKPIKGEGETDEAYQNRLTQYQSYIKGIVSEMQKWRDLQLDIEKADKDVFTSLIGSAVDLQSEVQRINDEYSKILESLNRLKNGGKISQVDYNKSSDIATANYQMKIVKASESYQFLIDGVVTMNKNAAKLIKRNFINALDKQLKAGAITAKQYADGIAEINKKMRDLEDAPSMFQSYLKGGFNGIAENIMNKGTSLIEQGAKSIQKGDVKTGEAMKNMGANMQQAGGQMMSAVSLADLIIHAINDFIDGLRETYNEIKEMFDAAGYNTNTDDWENWGAFFDSLSSISSGITKAWDSAKNGDVGGVISGVVGAFTKWYTVNAEAHDRKDENLIKSIEHNIRALEMNTEAIKGSRERTLGYDYGVINRRLSEYYSPGNKLNAGLYDPDAIADLKTDIQGLVLLALPNAMTEYYGNKSDLTGYKQELENLKKERDDIAIQWAAEKDKKKESQEALDEYVKKIAELDEQILYFTEDLAKELWGIDMKSWASQISDALWTAFENGEDAVKAFGDVADDIIADVAKKMMNIHLIEPVMKDLEAQLFGGVDSNGNRFEGKAYNLETGEWNEKETLQILGKFFGEDGEFAKVVNSAEDFYRMAEQTSGREFGSDSSSSSMSNTIKGITEQTADLLASYLNAVRLDVSVIREMESKAVLDYWPSQIRLMTSSNDSLVNIEQHTAAIMRSNDAIERSNQAILDRIDGLKNKAWKMPIA